MRLKFSHSIVQRRRIELDRKKSCQFTATQHRYRRKWTIRTFYNWNWEEKLRSEPSLVNLVVMKKYGIKYLRERAYRNWMREKMSCCLRLKSSEQWERNIPMGMSSSGERSCEKAGLNNTKLVATNETLLLTP